MITNPMRVAIGALTAAGMLLGAIGDQQASGNRLSEHAAHSRDRCPGMPLPDGPEGRDIVVRSRVGFHAARNSRTWEQGDAAPATSYPDGRVYSKIALFVRGAAPVSLRMHSPGEIAGWSSQQPTTEITIPQGSACAGTGWHWFPGGPLAPRPGGCVELEVMVAGHSKTVPFGLRRACS